jgi:hypothetical protein
MREPPGQTPGTRHSCGPTPQSDGVVTETAGKASIKTSRLFPARLAGVLPDLNHVPFLVVEEERAADVGALPNVFRLGLVAGGADLLEERVDVVDEKAELVETRVPVAEVLGGRLLDLRHLALLELDQRAFL